MSMAGASSSCPVLSSHAHGNLYTTMSINLTSLGSSFFRMHTGKCDRQSVRREVRVVAVADHYRLLGVARDATREEIAQAWRRRARSEHPDRRPGEAGDEAAARFRELAEAYRVLGDP